MFPVSTVVFKSLQVSADAGSTEHITNHLIKLRREKMEMLKKELSEVGATVVSVDVDPSKFTGIRRLRIIHARAKKDAHPADGETKSFDSLSSVKRPSAPTPSNSREILRAADGKAMVGKPEIVAADFEGFGGYSKEASIGIIAGAVGLFIMLSYVIYKYMTWKPKMVARKGYRAVTKSKGIANPDSGAEAGNEASDVARQPPLIVSAASKLTR
jgi:hypothetical protein